MSRLGKTPIPLPGGIDLNVSKGSVQIKGPKGSQSLVIPNGISVLVKEREVPVLLDEKSGLPRPRHGLYRSLVYNAVVGVSKGFEKRLTLVGVGYRAAVKGDVLDLSLGFSHPCQLKIPPEIEVSVEKSTSI